MTKLVDIRWDKERSSQKKSVSSDDKRAMFEYYRAGRKTGRPVEELLDELSLTYHRTPRQIQRYIAKVRTWESPAEVRELADKKVIDGDVKAKGQKLHEEIENSPRFQKHCDDVSDLLKTLAQRERLVLRWQNEGVRFNGDIVQGGLFEFVQQHDQRETSGPITGPVAPFMPTSLQPIDAQLVGSAFQHFKQKFPEFASLRSWEEMGSEEVDCGILDKMLRLANSRAYGLCPECLICQDLLKHMTQ